MKEIIAFFISGREYGVEISGMQSLESSQEIKPFPEAPECILGTIEIRDEIYPVYDIRARFMFPKAEHNANEKILLLRTRAGSLACIVDDVGSVFRVEGEDIQSFPKVAQTGDTAYIDFIARRDNQLVVVINPNELLTDEECSEIQKIDFTKTPEDE